jgi:hypothetical protein
VRRPSSRSRSVLTKIIGLQLMSYERKQFRGDLPWERARRHARATEIKAMIVAAIPKTTAIVLSDETNVRLDCMLLSRNKERLRERGNAHASSKWNCLGSIPFSYFNPS